MTRPEIRSTIPRIGWHVRCLDCHAAGMFYLEAEAHDWAEAHHCPPQPPPDED